MGDQRAVLGETGHEADTAVDVEGRDTGEVGGSEAVPDEVSGCVLGAPQPAWIGEGLVEEEQEPTPGHGGERDLGVLLGLGGIHVPERHDLGLLAVLPNVEILGLETPHGLSLAVDDEHREEDE